MKNKEIEQEHIEWQEKWNKDLLEYGRPIEDFKFVAIGYLDITEEFEKGIVTSNFINKLKILWNEGGATMSLGFHECDFCIYEGISPRGQSSSEKTLIDKDNNIKYLFPEMIFHYCQVHNFKPSNKFIEFVMRN